MADPQDIQDKIERFVLGEMPAAEAANFSAQVANDAALAEEVANFRALREDMQAMDEADFMGKMKGMAAEMRETPDEDAATDMPKVSWLRRRWPYAVAAALLLLLVPTLMLLRGTGDEALFQEYFTPYADVATGRGSNDADFLAGMKAYNAEDYAAARPHFTRFLATVPADQDGLFYGGIVEAVAGTPALAISRLEQLRNQAGIFQVAATWYQALAHLRAGERPRARSLLESLASSENSFQEQARALLRQL